MWQKDREMTTRCVHQHLMHRAQAQPNGRLCRDFQCEQEMGSEVPQNRSQNSRGDVRGKPQQWDFTMNWLLLLSGQTKQCPHMGIELHNIKMKLVTDTACPTLNGRLQLNYKLKLTQNCISFFPLLKLIMFFHNLSLSGIIMIF